PIIPSEANLADGEQRTAQRKVEAVLIAPLHRWVAVICTRHRVELRNRFKFDPCTPGCLRVAERLAAAMQIIATRERRLPGMLVSMSSRRAGRHQPPPESGLPRRASATDLSSDCGK